MLPYKQLQTRHCQFGYQERNYLLCIAEVIMAGAWALRFHQAASSPGPRGLYWLHGLFVITTK
jgi:hypothetical protein